MEQLDLHRLHFAFTVIVHYLFPQLTMGLALLLVVLKTMALRGDGDADASVRFWSKIFAITFVMGVVTGIPMEFQFGTNWARFSAATGGVIGHALAMEGVFAFFLESSLLYVVLFGEKRLGPRGHWLATLLLWLGTWLSGYFIVCTNAWMQYPVGYELTADGTAHLVSLAAVLTSPWAIHQYMHTMVGATITGSFVMAAIGAYYLLRGEHLAVARRFTSVAAVTGLVASVLALMPTGDIQAKLVYRHQPVTFAAMEGHFHTADGAGLVLIGQPNLDTMHLDNPLVIPRMLSFLTHQRWDARIEGLTAFDRERWPTNVPLLYYSYHIMVGLGTIFIVIMALAVWSLLRSRLQVRRWLLWILMLSLPFPFIANTAGWMTAELGRQPWIVHDVMRTSVGYSTNVSSGNSLFTLLGFAGLYLLLGVVYFFLATRIIAHGPQTPEGDPQPMTPNR
jgi:cytochrome d ubiquinol oxidase subunit I